MKELFKLWDSEDKKVIEVEAKKVGKEWKALCPKHDDKKASLLINEQKEVYHCFGCPFKGHLHNPTKHLTRKPKKKAQEEAISINYEKMEERAKEYHQKLPQGIREVLREERGLSDKVIDKYGIGYALRHQNIKDLPYKEHKDCFTIPVMKGEKLVNVRYHTRVKEVEIKDLPYQTGLKYATWLYPEEQLDNDTLIVTEGELDALCCISHGLPAITRTCGALVWKSEFTNYFKHKTVHICQDCDKAGREGAEIVAQELVKVAKEVRIIDLNPESNKGQDLTDWFVNDGKSKEELLKLIKQSSVYIDLSLPGEILKEKQKPKKKPERIFITGRQLIEEEIPEPIVPVGKGFFVPERYTILAASDGEGKTTSCTQLALSVITGTTFLNFFPIPKPAKVLYFCGENSRGDIKAKIEFQRTEIEKLLKRSIIEDLENNLIIVEPININFLLIQRDKEQLYGWIEDHKPNIVIFDPLADFISSANSISDDRLARGTVKLLTELAQTFKCFPLLTTHFKKEAINPVTGRSIVTLDNAWDMVHGSKYWLNSAASQIVIIRANLQRYPKAKKIGFKFKTVTEVKPRQVFRNENLWYEELPPDQMDKAKLTPEDVKDVLERKFEGEGKKALPSILEDVAHKELDCTQRQIRELIKLGKEQGLFWKNKVGQIEIVSLAVNNKLFDNKE